MESFEAGKIAEYGEGDGILEKCLLITDENNKIEFVGSKKKEK